MNGTRGTTSSTAWLVGGMLAVSGSALLLGAMGHLPSDPMLLGAVAMMTGAGASVGAARRWLGTRTNESASRRKRILVVGIGAEAEHLAEQALIAGYEVLGFVEDAATAQAQGWSKGLLGARDTAAQLARDLAVDQVIVADGVTRGWDLLASFDREGTSSELLVIPRHHETSLCRPSKLRVGDVALVRLERQPRAPLYFTAKRALDVSASAFILAAGAPVLLLAAAAIKATDGGSPLFWQERVGKDGRTFKVVKFRTMIIDAEKAGPQLCKGKGDVRLTPVGRFLRRTHLDEVPQVVNVLRGEMSLVGPRPERPCFVEQFEQELPDYAKRHRVLPGITGLAQIEGDYHSTAREKLRFDLMYANHPSLLQDIAIIARTVLTAIH